VQFPDQKVVLDRYLRPTDSEVGSVLTGKILTATGEVIHCNTFRHLTDAEIASSDNQKERDKFDETVDNRCGVTFKEPELSPSLSGSVTTPDYELYDNDNTKQISLPEIDDIIGTTLKATMGILRQRSSYQKVTSSRLASLFGGKLMLMVNQVVYQTTTKYLILESMKWNLQMETYWSTQQML
jgi:hypothetical protein